MPPRFGGKPGQQVVRALSWRCVVEQRRVADTGRHGTTLQCHRQQLGLDGDEIELGLAHFSFLLYLPTGQTRMHSKH